MFLILLAMRPVAAVHRWCQRWPPSHILVRRVRTRAGLRSGIPLALLGLYFGVGLVCVGMVQTGGGMVESAVRRSRPVGRRAGRSSAIGLFPRVTNCGSARDVGQQ